MSWKRLSVIPIALTRCGHVGADVRPDWGPHVNKRHAERSGEFAPGDRVHRRGACSRRRAEGRSAEA
jgi:hypothetical protein